MVNGEQIVYVIKKFIDDEFTEFIDPDEKFINIMRNLNVVEKQVINLQKY